MLEPAASDPERDVLLGIDPRLDDARDLVAVPGHDPQVRIQLLAAEREGEVAVGLLARAPVVAERLALGLEDGAMLIRRHRPELQSLGQGCVGDIGQRRPAHAEEPADRVESLALEQRSMAVLVLVCRSADLDGQPGRFAGRPFLCTPEVLAEECSTEALPADLRAHRAPSLVDGHAIAHDPLGAGLGDGSAVDLGDDHVACGIDAHRALDPLAQVACGRQPRDPVVEIGRRHDLGDRLVISVITPRTTESKAFDPWGVGHSQRVSPGGCGHGVSVGAGTPVHAGNGLVQSMLMLATSKPSEL